MRTEAKAATMDPQGRSVETDYQPQEARRERDGLSFLSRRNKFC